MKHNKSENKLLRVMQLRNLVSSLLKDTYRSVWVFASYLRKNYLDNRVKIFDMSKNLPFFLRVFASDALITNIGESFTDNSD